MSRNFGIPQSRYAFETRWKRPSLDPRLYPLITNLAIVAAITAAFSMMWMAAN